MTGKKAEKEVKKQNNKQKLFFEKIARFLRRAFAIQAISIQQIIKKLAVSNFLAIENKAKDRALKVINKISRAKFSAANIHDLILLICKKLEEEFEGQFRIVLKEKKTNTLVT